MATKILPQVGRHETDRSAASSNPSMGQAVIPAERLEGSRTDVEHFRGLLNGKRTIDRLRSRLLAMMRVEREDGGSDFGAGFL